MNRGFSPYPNAYLYRDWVVKAFNDDMPYDLFVKAQIAGDLLGAEEPEKLVPGLGFFALSPQFHQQMSYAVVMTTIKNFERANGRPVMWSDPEDARNTYVGTMSSGRGIRPPGRCVRNCSIV